MIPYGRQTISEEDIEAVCKVLRSEYLTTGPIVTDFECGVADVTEAKYAVAVSSGTAALHVALLAAGIKCDDEVIVPPITFAATANAIIYCGATPTFSDIDENTLLINPDLIEEKITPKTKAIIAVDYAGQPCDYPALRKIADKHGLCLLSDACHSMGAKQNGVPVGSLADMTVFSFHPVKSITTGEGGMVVTNNPIYADAMLRLRNHGIDKDYHQRLTENSWEYDIGELGYNYRITDIQCALGLSQLQRLSEFIEARYQIAEFYRHAFSKCSSFSTLVSQPGNQHANHFFVIKLAECYEEQHRASVFTQLREAGIGVNVHYRPVYLNTLYHKKLGYAKGLCPTAEACYQRIISLPVYPGLSSKDQDYIIDQVLSATKKILGHQ